jgi:hypothetical protein
MTLCVKFANWNAERPLRHSHAERGNDQDPLYARVIDSVAVE